jgi:hypothetical protein
VLPSCHSVTQKTHKHAKKGNKHNFQEDVLCKTVLENDNKGQSLTVKKVTLVLREKTAYKGSVHILFI